MLNYIKRLLRLIFKITFGLIFTVFIIFIIYEITLAVRIEHIAKADNASYKNETFSDDLQIHMVNVGQGDGFVITYKDKIIVVDCGTVIHSGTMKKYLQNMGVKRINALIITHPHQDHFGGLDKLVCNFKVDKIYTTEISTKTKMTLIERFHLYRFNSTIAMFDMFNNYSKVESFKNNDGSLKSFTMKNEIKVTFLGPLKSYKNINNNSLVFKLEYKDISVLFTGDIEKEAEMDLIEKYKDELNVDILKLAHHASHTSSTEEFLESTNPQVGLISCSIDNDFWHPHKQVARRLKEKGIKLYRTDEDGDIIISSDGYCIESNNKEGDYKSGSELRTISKK